ncbi:MAG: hypothetical protein WCT99_02920 [Bacteroidota bacterium]|jgi:hypothetical protein
MLLLSAQISAQGNTEEVKKNSDTINVKNFIIEKYTNKIKIHNQSNSLSGLIFAGDMQ